MKISGESVHSGMKRPRLSPLRYPGGKSALYPLLRALIRENGFSEGTYVEPYAGGAGAALGLLVTGEVRRIVVNDKDPTVYAFWKAAVTEPAAFSRLVADARLSVDEWHRQKDTYINADRADYLALGFATFYLNRTNRSGVLNGGPIGGLDQTGNYKIDARFNKATLLERLRLIETHARRIRVTKRDGISVIKEYASKPSTFIYADPPYFTKAGSLYMNAFKPEDHSNLSACLNGLSNGHWMLTYDNVSDIEQLYRDRSRHLISLSYSAHHIATASEVLVLSDGLEVPCLDGLVRVSD